VGSNKAIPLMHCAGPKKVMPPAAHRNGFNNHLARRQGIHKLASTYIFGPLIDPPPAHQDIIITILLYMQRSLVDMKMSYFHLSIDMEVFVITK